MLFSNIMKEIASILYWMMLAACTVGPGTVVTCARAGAEFDLSLIWALVFATCMAFTLQEGTARLTIVSGRSLGQCLRVKYRHSTKLFNTAIICWVVAALVVIGNTLIEANCWAGGIDAIMAIPGATELKGSAAVGLRVGSCLAYAVVVLALLYFDKTEMLGICLGMVMMGMVSLFLIVVFYMGMDWAKFGWGLLPNIPAKTDNSAEPADIIMSLVGTTSLGFNLFLGGAMAKGKDLSTAQRGIALSVTSALVVSTLILIVGAGFHQDGGPTTSFTISQLSIFIEQFVGRSGVIIFAIGFIAAALSSMLTIPLGAAITADTVFSQDVSEVKEKIIQSESKDPSTNHKNDIPLAAATNAAYNVSTQGVGVVVENNLYTESNHQAQDKQSTELELENTAAEPKRLPWSIYFGIILIEVIISTVIISANADRTLVVLVAQTFNGCLLPFFSICLLLCLNDPQFMSSSPQPGWANVFLLSSVVITLFLASNVIIQKILGTVLTAVSARLGVAIGVAVGIMTVLCTTTSLGKELVLSFKKCVGKGNVSNN